MSGIYWTSTIARVRWNLNLEWFPGRRSSGVEQPIRNRQVEGSNPPAGSSFQPSCRLGTDSASGAIFNPYLFHDAK